MIKVILIGEEGELGKITLEKITDHPDGSADYSARFAVDRVGAVGMHQRVIHGFPRTEYNVLALLLQALNTLEPEELSLESTATPDFDSGKEHGPSLVSRYLGWGGTPGSKSE